MEKILIIANVEQHIISFHLPCIKMLQEEGYEVHVATKLEHGRERLEAQGIICHFINFARSPFSLHTLTAIYQLIRLMKRHRFSLVHVHTPVGGFLGRLAAKYTGTKPVLYTAHGFHFYQGANWRSWALYYSLERLAAKWTSGLITINTEDYEIARDKFDLRTGEDLFHVHGVGVALNSPEANRENYKKELCREFDLTDDEVIVVCIAELMKNKNHSFLLDAWSQMAERQPKGYLFLIGKGDYENEIVDKVNLQAIPRVRFLGYRSDVPQLLKAIDIGVLVSWREGLPRSVMEMMAAGLPVIGSRIRGNRDLIEDGKTGFLVELRDVSGLANSLEKLIDDANLRYTMGMEGRRKVEQYSLANVLKELDPIYSRYMTGGRQV
jgi:glycosyltransferase involved in cell wall biosynthesis